MPIRHAEKCRSIREATLTLDAKGDPVRAIMERTHWRGVDVAIEALGTQDTFENALRVLAPVDSVKLGVYSGHLTVPLEGIDAGLADQTIVTTLVQVVRNA